MLEITSKNQPKELKEWWEEDKYHSHIFKRSSGNQHGCVWEYLLHISVEGGESKYPSITWWVYEQSPPYKYISQEDKIWCFVQLRIIGKSYCSRASKKHRIGSLISS